MLKYDTLYQSMKKVTAEWHAGHLEWSYYWSYIVFFIDGTLLEGVIVGQDTQVIKSNFLKESKNLIHGKYSWVNNQLEVNINEIILIGGLTFDDKLILQSKSSLTWELYSPIS